MLNSALRRSVALAVCINVFSVASSFGMNPERKVVAASEVLREMLNAPAKGIPLSMIADAEAVVIIPEVVKVGFVVGVQRGEGVVLVRDQNRVWQLPRFITITAGSVGWQIGAESSDFVLVFKTRRGVDGLMNGKFTIGAATDAKLGAEIYTYSRSRGLFAGVSLAGSSLDIDPRTDAAFYGNLPGQPPAQVPQSALQLVSLITSISEGVQPAAHMPITAPVAVEPIEQEREAILASARALGPVLDDQWRQYLALPESLSTPGAAVDPASLKQVIDRFNTIAQDQRYTALNKRPEFNATRDALTRYYNTLTTNPNNPLNLPPPPIAN